MALFQALEAHCLFPLAVIAHMAQQNLCLGPNYQFIAFVVRVHLGGFLSVFSGMKLLTNYQWNSCLLSDE